MKIKERKYLRGTTGGRLIVMFIALLLLRGSSVGQSFDDLKDLKELSFPEYGFKVSFFTKAKKAVLDQGKESERIEYTYEWSSSDRKYWANLTIFLKGGCEEPETMYNNFKKQLEKPYKGDYPALPVQSSRVKSIPFGWVKYDAISVLGKEVFGFKHRTNLAAYFNGKVGVIIKMLGQNMDGGDMPYWTIEDSFTPLPRSLELEKYGIAFGVKGNVWAVFNKELDGYELLRCLHSDRFPHGRVKQFSGATVQQLYNLILEEYKKIPNTVIKESGKIEKDPVLMRIKSDIYRIDMEAKMSSEGKQVDGRAISYVFEYEGKGYLCYLRVPYVRKDDHEYSKRTDAVFDEKDAKKADESFREIIGSIKVTSSSR
ncbi:MAG: hypothetical protein J5I50_10380 [Chitinophagaceae bacterium]|nr:hypothetical protein [Chitinophagaceae bacterium]